MQVAATGNGLAGATVALLAPVPGEDEFTYLPWDGSDYGQPNPVTSNASGRYHLFAPAGLYQLYVTAPGYQPYRSGLLTVDGVISQTIALALAVNGEANTIVAITEVGFEPAIVAVQPGSPWRHGSGF